MKVKIFRCRNCGKLLFEFKLNGTLEIEIKCPRCKELIKKKLE